MNNNENMYEEMYKRIVKRNQMSLTDGLEFQLDYSDGTQTIYSTKDVYLDAELTDKDEILLIFNDRDTDNVIKTELLSNNNSKLTCFCIK